MAQVYKKLILDVNKSNPGIIAEAVQNDAQSRYLDIVLLDGSTPINLTGHEVRIFGKKFDGKEIFNNGEITDPTAGRCQFEMTSQTLAAAGDLEMQIKVFYDNVEILSTQSFKIKVVKDLMSPSAIESSNEYGALVVLYQNLYEAYDLMVEMVQKIGVPGEQAQLLNLDTMFEVWDWMVEYLQANSTAGVVETVNTILGRIGVHNSTNGTDVMGKLNGIYTNLNRRYVYPSLVVKKETLFSGQTAAMPTHYKLVAKFVPPFSGVVRLRFQVRNASTTTGATMQFLMGEKGTNVLEQAFTAGNFIDYSVPIGTSIQAASTLGDTSLVYDCPINRPTYITMSTNIEVKRGIPLMLWVWGATSLLNNQGFIKDVELYYDFAEV